jgi:hypothetical protein
MLGFKEQHNWRKYVQAEWLISKSSKVD